MAKAYRPTWGTRALNRVFGGMTRLGIGASYRWILLVRGRRTGVIRSTPVDAIEADGHRWLVAGYGPAAWVGNVRAAGEVTLSRGKRRRTFTAVEAGPAEAVPILRRYMRTIGVTRRYFDARPASSDAGIAAELRRHAVFRLDPTDGA